VYGGNGLRGYSSTFTHEGYYALVGRQGHLCGNINYAQGQFFASEHALVVSLKGEYETTWLGELLRTMNLGQYSQAAAQPGLSAERLVNLIIPVPPLVEQKEIVDFIEAKTSKINKAATAIHTQIHALKDYRQSLISEVVTGKIDVRAAEPVAPEADLPLWRHLV
jgi:type I restriction enzyme S subunit